MPETPQHRLKREEIWQHTLSKHEVHDILLSDESEQELSKIYKVTIQTIRHIRQHCRPEFP